MNTFSALKNIHTQNISKDNTTDNDIESRLTRITYYAENLEILSKGLATIYPEAKGAVGCIADAIKKEAKKALDLYFEEKKENKAQAETH